MDLCWSRGWRLGYFRTQLCLDYHLIDMAIQFGSRANRDNETIGAAAAIAD